MIKNEQDVKYYNEIRHLISSLYKIKTIDRRIPYTNPELRRLVFESPIGKNVLEKFKQKKVSVGWLIKNGFTKVATVFWNELPYSLENK